MFHKSLFRPSITTMLVKKINHSPVPFQIVSSQDAKKRRKPRIPTWSPTVVLTRPEDAWLRWADGKRYYHLSMFLLVTSGKICGILTSKFLFCLPPPTSCLRPNKYFAINLNLQIFLTTIFLLPPLIFLFHIVTSIKPISLNIHPTW